MNDRFGPCPARSGLALFASALLFTPPTQAEIVGAQTEQSITTHGAFDWHPFTLNGALHLVVANCNNDQTSNINSVVYRWDGGSLTPIQEIAGSCTTDWESFTIDGTTYLSQANLHSDSSSNVQSRIYRWDGSQFVVAQSLATAGARDIESFEMGGTAYLIVANSDDDTSLDIPSKLYRWDGSAFVEIQSITTHGAYHWEHFTIDGDHFLAVANTRTTQNLTVDSMIYRWDGTQFVEYQAIPEPWVGDIAPFSIGTEQYLAIADVSTGSSRATDSKIYHWDGTQFVEQQAIPTNGAIEWEPFEWNGEHYLAVANYASDSSFHTNSVLYRWDGVQFTQTLTIPTIGAEDWAFFSADGVPYLAGANFYDGATHNLQSSIYRLNEILAPQPVATATPLSGTAPLTVELDASASNDPDGGTITGYQWLTSDAQSAGGATASFTFTQPGSYSIQLTVTDDEGETASSTIDIQVTAVDATNCEGRASYSAATGELHLPLMDVATVPLLGGIGRPAGETTVPAEATLRIIPGTTLFEIQSVISATPDAAPAVTPCHSLYTIDGVLDVPRVDVPIVTAIGGISVTTGIDTYHATLEQVPMSDLFQLTGIQQLP